MIWRRPSKRRCVPGAPAALRMIDPLVPMLRRETAALAAKHRLPVIYTHREDVEAGGLVAYGTNLPEQYRQAATFVHKILRGAKPADLPMEQPMRFELVMGVTGCARKSHAARGNSITSSGLLGSTSTRDGYHRWVACAMRYRLQSSQAPLREGRRPANLAWALSIVQRMPERSLRSGITWRQAPSITPEAIGEPAARDTSSCLRGGGLAREPQRWARWSRVVPRRWRWGPLCRSPATPEGPSPLRRRRTRSSTKRRAGSSSCLSHRGAAAPRRGVACHRARLARGETGGTPRWPAAQKDGGPAINHRRGWAASGWRLAPAGATQPPGCAGAETSRPSCS